MTGQAHTYRSTVADIAGVTAGQLVDVAERKGHHSAGWWAMLIVIMNEAVIFASLVASYFYLRFNSPTWPQDNLKRPELILPAIMTVLQVSSSLFMQWGLSSIKRGRTGRMRLALLIALLLAAGFLGMQAYEYTHSEFGPQTNAYGSLFFTITGIHGLHVLIAILMNLFIQVRAGFQHFTARRHLAVENVSLYWHFVDIVWLVIFTSLYLSTYLS